MNFQPAAWQVRHARIALETWNDQHPERTLPWEWVEELLLAWREWKEFAHVDDSGTALAAHKRYLEFSAKLPAQLLMEIFPQA